MKEFTFGVLIYNQSSIVLETLESIKYQKLNYGEDIFVNLYIIDDASKDASAETVSVWLDVNRHIFSEVSFEINTENCGTVMNYQKMMGKIGDEPFKLIAGDDLISSSNLFVQYEDMTSHKLKTYVRIHLVDGKIKYDENMLCKYFYNMKHISNRKHVLKHFRKGCFFHTPSTLYSKQLFVDAECEKILKHFCLFEDDPTWYSMLKNVKDIQIDFADECVVLYRMHNASVSNVRNPIFESELQRLYEMYRKDAGCVERVYHWFRSKQYIPKHVRIDKYLDKINSMRIQKKVIRNPEYKCFKQKIEEQIIQEQLFYNKIRENVKTTVH